MSPLQMQRKHKSANYALWVSFARFACIRNAGVVRGGGLLGVSGAFMVRLASPTTIFRLCGMSLASMSSPFANAIRHVAPHKRIDMQTKYYINTQRRRRRRRAIAVPCAVPESARLAATETALAQSLSSSRVIGGTHRRESKRREHHPTDTTQTHTHTLWSTTHLREMCNARHQVYAHIADNTQSRREQLWRAPCVLAVSESELIGCACAMACGNIYEIDEPGTGVCVHVHFHCRRRHDTKHQRKQAALSGPLRT